MAATKSRRGFAAMDPAKQREIASMGGRAAHEKGTAHEFTTEEARRAGRRGGLAVGRDREYMAEIGRRGGLRSRGGRGRPDDEAKRRTDRTQTQTAAARKTTGSRSGTRTREQTSRNGRTAHSGGSSNSKRRASSAKANRK